MKQIILLVALSGLCIVNCFAQKVTGQWRGSFNSNGDLIVAGSSETEYVLELDIKGTRVTGSSYSYFQGRKYYVICRLEGTYYKASKSVKVTEVERIQGNTPPDFSDCLQVHYLTYEKEGKTEKMVGRWKTAPGQLAGCGEGNTTLVRRTLTKDLASFNKKATTPQAGSKKADNAIAKKDQQKAKPVISENVAVRKTPSLPTKEKLPATPKKIVPPIAKKQAAPKPKAHPSLELAKVTAPAQLESPASVPSRIIPEIAEVKSDINFEKRKTDVLKTIELENETFKIDLYDNGEVDGDSVSVFYNGKLILSHKRLSEKPISLNLPIQYFNKENELVMYAENLGEIAPNTALMVVHDGDKRYEVRISSDLKNSGTIRFIHRPRTQ